MSDVLENFGKLQITPQKNAYVAVVWGDIKYLIGALAMAFSLKNIKTKYPIILMIGEDMLYDENICKKVFDIIIPIQVTKFKCIPPKTAKQKEFYGGYFQETVMNKWKCMDLIEYDKVLFVDSDIIFQHNPDDLFALTAPAGCFSNPFMKPYAPKGGLPNPYGVLKHGQKINAEQVMFNMSTRTSCVNGAIVLLEPKIDDFNKLIKMIEESKDGYGHLNNYSTSDEQAICEFYSRNGKDWENIDPIYEAIPWKIDGWVPQVKGDITKIVGLHYYHSKVWTKGEGFDWDDTKHWWLIFNKFYGGLFEPQKKYIKSIVEKEVWIKLI